MCTRKLSESRIWIVLELEKVRGVKSQPCAPQYPRRKTFDRLYRLPKTFGPLLPQSKTLGSPAKTTDPPCRPPKTQDVRRFPPTVARRSRIMSTGRSTIKRLLSNPRRAGVVSILLVNNNIRICDRDGVVMYDTLVI